MNVERWNAQRDGPVTEAGLKKRLESRGYRVVKYVFAPGTFFGEHDHAIDKIDAVLSGRVRVTLNGEVAVLEPGDSVEIPRGTRHTAEVLGGDPVISLDATRP